MISEDDAKNEAIALRNIGILSDDDMSEKYGELCFLAEKIYHGIPIIIEVNSTSEDARCIAEEIFSIMYGGTEWMSSARKESFDARRQEQLDHYNSHMP